MANEIEIEYPAGEGTLYAVVRKAGTNTRWNGTAWVAASTIADSAWTTGQIALTEEVSSDATGTGVYHGDLPGDGTAGLYTAEAFLSTARAVASLSVATQDIEWDGTQIAVPRSATSITIESENISIEE